MVKRIGARGYGQADRDEGIWSSGSDRGEGIWSSE